MVSIDEAKTTINPNPSDRGNPNSLGDCNTIMHTKLYALDLDLKHQIKPLTELRYISSLRLSHIFGTREPVEIVGSVYAIIAETVWNCPNHRIGFRPALGSAGEDKGDHNA